MGENLSASTDESGVGIDFAEGVVPVALTTEHTCVKGVKTVVIMYHVESKVHVSNMLGATNGRREPDAEIPRFIHNSSTGAFGRLNVPVTLEYSGTDKSATEEVKKTTGSEN